LPRAFGRVQHLPGTCLSIATDFAHNNFGHYVLDCLSRLELFKQTGGRLEDVDHVFPPPPPGRSARRALQMMGVPEKKCAWATPGSWVKAEKLIVTSFPGLKRNYPDWLPRALQQYFPELPRSSTRVYMPRTGSRRAINEAELIEIAREFGFEVYDHEKCAGEPEFFSSVEAVVGAHGAQLTNLAWCRPGTKVLELISSDHRYPYYYTVADSAQLEYHCLGGQSLESRPPGSTAPSLFDFHVDPTEFRETLVAMGL
jgi:capsular polysaccharide biosynthesis protein